MKIIRLFCILFSFLLGAHAAYADSCQTLLCMAGKLQGQNGGHDCDQPIADYFNILVFGRHDRFDPSATANARMDYLSSCPAPGDGSVASQINAAYGTVRSE